MRKRWTICLSMLLLAACNMTVPQVTPTVAPTITLSATQFVTSTPTIALTATIPFTSTLASSATPTASDIPSETPTLAPTVTLPPTETNTVTDTLTASTTNTGTASPTLTATASLTATETATPTDTLTASATNTGTARPTLTPSVTPSFTATRSPTTTRTATQLPTETPTSTRTSTPTQTRTNTLTPSATSTATASLTATFAPSLTFTPSPTSTATPRPSLTFTPAPTQTFTLTPSATPTTTRTPAVVVVVPSPLPTFTVLPSNTIPPSLTPPPPPTPLPLPGTALFPTPTLEIAPVGVREETPQLITAAPETEAAIVTPVEAGSTPEPPTLTALPAFSTPLPLLPTSLPTFDPLLIPNQPQTRAFALSTEGGVVTSNELPLPFSATTFARNPLDPNSYAVVDARGLLYLFNGGLNAEQGALLRTSPFAEPEPQTRETNNAIVVQVAYSPDGQYLALLIDAEKDDRDGIWLLPTGQGTAVFNRQIFRECPPPIQNACTVVIGGEPNRYTSLRFEWNASSSALLNTLFLPDENRRAFTVVPIGNDPTNIPPILRYDYASWSQDGSRVLVSGAGADGRVGLRWVDPASGAAQMIFDGSAVGLWVQDAVERPDGQIVALGSPNGPSSPQSLYNSSGQPLSGQIGTGAPERVTWSPDRSAVLVVVNDTSNPVGAVRRYYVAEVDGTISEITGQVAGALAVEWLGGVLPPLTLTPVSSPTAAPVQPTSAEAIAPAGAVAPVGQVPLASAYGITVNQQVQVIAPAGVNLRAQPSQSAVQLDLLNSYDYIVVIGGPVQLEGIIWWQVETGTAQIGWVAEAIGNVQLLSVEPR